MKAYLIVEDGNLTKDFELKPKVFKSGSVGLHGFGKFEAGGKRYQINILVVEIGSKRS